MFDLSDIYHCAGQVRWRTAGYLKKYLLIFSWLWLYKDTFNPLWNKNSNQSWKSVIKCTNSCGLISLDIYRKAFDNVLSVLWYIHAVCFWLFLMTTFGQSLKKWPLNIWSSPLWYHLSRYNQSKTIARRNFILFFKIWLQEISQFGREI